MSNSIRKRFLFTVGANLCRALISFLTGMLLARWLGPGSYGKMAFLLGTFMGIRQLLDMGSTSAFFTFMSQRPRSREFVRSFFAWLAIQFLVPLCLVGFIFPVQWVDTIWQGEERGLVLLAFAAVFMQHSVWPAVQQAGESQRRTVFVQTVGVVVIVGHFLAVVLLWRWNSLGLYAVFTAIVLEYLLASFVAHKNFPYAPIKAGEAMGMPPGSLFRKYLHYCGPLIFFSWASFAYQFVDRWMLQKYGGSFEQAYYAVAAQVAGVALIATSSILRIFWKEVAEAHYQGDHARAGRLYQKVSRLLFYVGSVIAGFLVPWSEDIIRSVLGDAYVSGSTTLAIMFLYPVHQSMGQIGLTMLVATERIMLRVVSGIAFMLFGMAATYLVLAPVDAAIPGLGLASEGLAMKMVGVQIVTVNILALLIARIWNWPFDWLFQPISLGGCVGFGWLAHAVLAQCVSGGWSLFFILLPAGLLYLVMIAAYTYTMPWQTGFSRDELISLVGGALRKLKTV